MRACREGHNDVVQLLLLLLLSNSYIFAIFSNPHFVKEEIIECLVFIRVYVQHDLVLGSKSKLG